MSVQHRDISDAYLHEPKGIVSATSNTVYVANGSGGGSWKPIDSTSMKGLLGDGGFAGKKIVTDGAGGFSIKTDSAYGSMVMNNNANAFTTIAAADTNLRTNAQYQLLTGTGAPWTSENLSGIVFNTDRLGIQTPGIYRADFTGSIKTFPSATAKVSVKLRINNSTYAVRNIIAKSNAAGDEEQITGFGMFNLAANDYIQVCVASAVAGSLVFSDFELTLTLIKAT